MLNASESEIPTKDSQETMLNESPSPILTNIKIEQGINMFQLGRASP